MLSRSFRLLAFFALLPLLTACGSPSELEDIDSAGAGMARLGRHLQEKGEIGGSIDFYQRALKNDPKNIMAIKGLASVLEQWGDKDAAAEVYRNGVAARPKDAELRRNYGKLLIGMDDPAGAKQQFEAALGIDSDDARAHNGLGIALDYLGEHLKAQKEYEKALREEPGNLSTINNLAYSHILARKFDKAIKTLEPHYAKPTATPALRQNLALAYGLSGMDVDAERIAHIDLPPEKVAENLNYYRLQRAEMKVDTTPYAELGTYATEAMAVAQIQKMQDKVAKTGGDLRPVVLPQVATPGGTPRFAVRMMGCSKPDDVSRLCDTLAKSGIPCVPRGKGAEMQ